MNFTEKEITDLYIKVYFKPYIKQSKKQKRKDFLKKYNEWKRNNPYKCWLMCNKTNPEKNKAKNAVNKAKR